MAYLYAYLGWTEMLRTTSIDLHRIREGLGLSYERMGRLLGVSGRTVERMESLGRPTRNAVIAERLAQLAQIVDLGQLVFTPDGWRQFLALPQPRCGARTAMDLMGCGELERVLAAHATDRGECEPVTLPEVRLLDHATSSLPARDRGGSSGCPAAG